VNIGLRRAVEGCSKQEYVLKVMLAKQHATLAVYQSRLRQQPAQAIQAHAASEAHTWVVVVMEVEGLVEGAKVGVGLVVVKVEEAMEEEGWVAVGSVGEGYGQMQAEVFVFLLSKSLWVCVK
jgi:hypothetical protein